MHRKLVIMLVVDAKSKYAANIAISDVLPAMVQFFFALLDLVVQYIGRVFYF